jgi:hypothetical protein
MSDKLIDELNSAFDAYDQKKEENRVSAGKKRTDHEIYLANFKSVCDEVIKPTMEELGQAIEKRGHKYKISRREESKDHEGKITPANIQLEIYLDGEQPDYINRNFPHLSFVAGTYDNKTYTHVSTMMPKRGGMAGKRNDYQLDEITPEAVKEEIVHIVATCFSK